MAQIAVIVLCAAMVVLSIGALPGPALFIAVPLIVFLGAIFSMLAYFNASIDRLEELDDE